MIVKAYHTTNVDHLDSIMKFGLIPGHEKPSGQPWLGKYSGSGIYLHSQLPMHELDDGCDDYGNPFIVTLKIVFDADPKLIVPDEDVSNNPKDGVKAYKNGESIVYLDKIDKNNIKSIYVPTIFGSEESEKIATDIWDKYGDKVARWKIVESKIKLKALLFKRSKNELY